MLAADPRVDDDTIAVECGESGYAVLRGSAGSPANVFTLSGTVRSVADRDAAVAAAADVPFVARVEDEIRVVA